mgnify:CR=1 FL=1
MDTHVLKRFAQEARISLQNKVRTKIEVVLHEESAARCHTHLLIFQIALEQNPDTWT